MEQPEATRELEDALACAYSIAHEHEHRVIGTAHLLVALLADPEVRAAVAFARADAARLEAAARAAVRATPEAAAPWVGHAHFGQETTPIRYHESAEQALEVAMGLAMAADVFRVGPVALLIALAENEDHVAGRLLARAGVSPLALKLHASIAAVPDPVPRDLTGAGPFTLLLLNDHYTTREFVVTVLAEELSFGEADAERIMTEVHERGAAVAAILPAAEARARAAAIERRAREAGHPLRVALAPARI